MRDHQPIGSTRNRTGTQGATLSTCHWWDAPKMTQGPKATWVRSSDILRFRDKGMLGLHKSYSHSGTQPLCPLVINSSGPTNTLRRERNQHGLLFISFSLHYNTDRVCTSMYSFTF